MHLANRGKTQPCKNTQCLDTTFLNIKSQTGCSKRPPFPPPSPGASRLAFPRARPLNPPRPLCQRGNGGISCAERTREYVSTTKDRSACAKPLRRTWNAAGMSAEAFAKAGGLFQHPARKKWEENRPAYSKSESRATDQVFVPDYRREDEQAIP